ncbi:hypothetical protein [Celeribacter litoreus]|uniref:hypothetical protein n=1 Tax=Celeribacter litoreus TaxID=2876714 RepID=UPI001CCB202A|nr:hypothetical protein [Celeribacter litoreus]MCA0044264.1 hypothetical protein [Celeribacter litoreus]
METIPQQSRGVIFMRKKIFERAQIARVLKTFVFLVSLSIWTTVATSGAYAARPKTQAPGATIIVRGDSGGGVRARYNEIQEINRLKQRVEIRSGACLSSCTMYLAVENMCVSPRAVFGFHGPYRLGPKLSETEFEEWSRFIAAHYPLNIRVWYLDKARHSVFSMSRLSGTELIRLGVPKCDP